MNHFNETKDMVTKSELSDSFARHFSQHLFSVRDQKVNKKVTVNDVRKIVSVKLSGKVGLYRV